MIFCQLKYLYIAGLDLLEPACVKLYGNYTSVAENRVFRVYDCAVCLSSLEIRRCAARAENDRKIQLTKDRKNIFFHIAFPP